MNARFNNNVVMAVCHMDERGLPYLHLDMLVITEDNRLSFKTLITRDFKLEQTIEEYNKLSDDKTELELKNKEKVFGIVNQQERSR